VVVVLVKRFLSPTLQSERELRVSVRDVNVFAYVPRETTPAALAEPSTSSSMPMLSWRAARHSRSLPHAAHQPVADRVERHRQTSC
jgi:hypothetical protein